MPKYACSINYANFASALITAKILGKRTFYFLGDKYRVADYIEGFSCALERGRYEIRCRPMPIRHN